MNARVLLILLIITVLLALTQRFRRIGVSLSVVLMGLMVWQAVNSVPGTTTNITDASSRATASSVASAPGNAVRINRIELSGSGAPWRLTGELMNTSDTGINAVKIVITRRSCADADAQPGSCQLLWQGEHTLRIKLPPGASQSFEESIWSHTPVPRPSGVVRDSFELDDIAMPVASSN